MATKIQVRRDTGAAWDGVKNDPSSALAPGEFGLDTDNNILKIGPGTWNDAQLVASGDLSAGDLQAVTDAGNNTTNAITIGPEDGDPVTTLADNGAATFANDGLRIQNDGELQLGGTTAAPNMIFKPNGSASIGGTLDVYNQFSVNSQDPNVAVLSGNLDDVQTTYIAASGSAKFAGTITHTTYDSSSASGHGFYLGRGLLVLQNPATGVSPSAPMLQGRIGNASPTFQINANGAATFTTVNGASVVLHLEPDDDSNYVTTTDAEGNESRVYNGPTLDVKAVLQDLQQRVADRDAVIGNLTTRLAALEADHATLMANGNSGGY